jgi:hypothetical protein
LNLQEELEVLVHVEEDRGVDIVLGNIMGEILAVIDELYLLINLL